ncbi:uncharacterized protein LOC118438318 [Folsomia candida]|nr:uncharacterized protein LOC118438318 [Folsomia candida]
MIQVGIYVCNFLATPNAPWYLYSYIYTEDNPWYWLLPGAFQEFVMGGQLIAIFLLIGWINVAHCISVEFWLQEAHKNYDSTWTTEELRDSVKSMETYRSLQLLNIIFNHSMAPLGIPVAKFVNWTAIVPCFYVLLRSMNSKFMDEFPGVLTYPLSVIDCVTHAYGMLQISSEMQGMSESYLTSWSATGNFDLRRVLVSCPTLKIGVAGFYKISVSTTVTFFRSIIEYTVNCIVTFK